MTDVDNMFHLPPELMSENIAVNAANIKALTNDDTFMIITSLSERINDIYVVVAALKGMYYGGLSALIPTERINSGNILRYLNLLNNACKALREILKNND